MAVGAASEGTQLSLTRALACRLVAAEQDGWPPPRLDHHARSYARYLTFLHRLGHAPPFALGLLDPRLVHLATCWLYGLDHDGPRQARDLGVTLLGAMCWLGDQGWLDGFF